VRGTEIAIFVDEVFALSPSFPFEPPPPPRFGPEWATWIIIIAVLFLAAVVVFYVALS